MKKTYIIPTSKVVKIQTTQLLNGSPKLNGTYNGGTVLSREQRNSGWDEDYEED